MGLKDGLSSLEAHAGTFSGTTLQVGAGEVEEAEIDVAFAQVLTGSPAAGGLTVQMGSAIASDVTVAVAYGTPFENIPRVVISACESGTLANASMVTSGVATGFRFFGQSGLAHNWIAIGSGRL